MRTFEFPAKFTRHDESDDTSYYVVTFRDVPDAISKGDTLQEST